MSFLFEQFNRVKSLYLSKPNLIDGWEKIFSNIYAVALLNNEYSLAQEIEQFITTLKPLEVTM